MFYKATCQDCGASVSLLAPEWQNQRQLKLKKSPSCSTPVEVVFSFRKFSFIVGLIALSTTVLIASGLIESKSIGVAISLSATSLVFCMVLRRIK